jgi:monoamine oxidase
MWDQVMGAWPDPLGLNESRSLSQLVTKAFQLGAISPADWDWLANVRGFRWLEDASALFWANVGLLLDTVGRYELVGGMSKLVDAFEDAILASGAVMRRNAAVSAIEADEHSVGVRFGNAVEQFDFAILALPAPCVARIDFTPGLPTGQMDALRSVHYFPVAKSVVLYRERFWEKPQSEGIAGGSSVTDLPNQQVWYPSDNARPASPAELDHLESRMAVIRGDRLDKMPVDSADWIPKSATESDRPGALIGGYMWGTNAERFGSLDSQSRDQSIRDCLELIHPGSSRHELKMIHRVWAQHANPGGGGFAYFRPYDQRRYSRLVCQPHPRGAAARLFFAGEHDGIAQGWIQGAIQSALAATASILSS